VQFTDEKIMDPTIRAQLHKVEVVADPEIEALFPALQRVIVTVVTTDGREFTKQVDYPKGDPRNPLSDQEIEEKFDALASPIMSEEERQRLKAAVWSLEDVHAISELMELTQAQAPAYA